MSLRTQIRGFTAWVNLRLKPYDQLLNNALMDLLSGTNMKMLIQSLTGHDFKKLQNFDGLTDGQKMTRIEWVLEELKRWKVIPQDVFVDARMFAMRNAEHVFGLLYRLVEHDIVFVWERAEYLQHEDPAILCEVPFKWIPEPPPVKAKKKKAKSRKSLLSGFGTSSLIAEKIDEDYTDTVVLDNYNPFPRSEFMKKFKVKLGTSMGGQSSTLGTPTPEECLLDLVNRQLKTLDEGRKLHVSTIDDLADSRVLCALTNSFIPNTFTTEVMMNDRWPINLVLKTIEKILYIDSPFDSEDLAEADGKSIGAYFCVFFMLAFKYRQMRAVVDMAEFYKRSSLEKQAEFDEINTSVTTSQDHLQRRRQLQEQLESIQQDKEKLELKFDVEFCYTWMDNIYDTIKQTRKDVLEKMASRYDPVSVPRSLTISTMCLAMSINLSLTVGNGFYLLDEKESITEGRRIVLYDKETHQYIDNYSNKNSGDYVKGLLKLPVKSFSTASYDVNPAKFPQFNIYLEAPSKNKQLMTGSYFLYQVFPTVPTPWHKILFTAVKSNEVETVRRLVTFFRSMPAVLNCKEPNTGNSPLHWAAKLGHYDIALSLLEGGANIDQQNSYQQTPLYAACDALQRHTAHLFIEWGCDVHAKAHGNRRAFDKVKNDETRDFLINCYEYYSKIVPQVMSGDVSVLKDILTRHVTEEQPLSNIRSRCINGSTLLHTAAYFGCVEVIETLLQENLDVNLLDYKGATAIHRASNTETMRILMMAGAKTNEEDCEGNTALHVKCYGEVGKPSEISAIQLLLSSGAKLVMRNQRNLLPIHCAAMQGRTDVIDLLLKCDQSEAMCNSLADEEHQPLRCKNPPSLIHLAVANDHTDSAIWLVKNSFTFKHGEPEILMQKILSEQIQLKERAEAIKFLLDNGASVNETYVGNNAALHYAASMSGAIDVMEALMASGADVNVINQDHSTPLMFACQSNNMYAASLLLANGASVRVKNLQGLTAFDFITDYEEWVDSGHFSDEMRARLKAYSLKHSRDLIRAISKKVKTRGQGWLMGGDINPSTSHGTPGLPGSRALKRSAMPGSRPPGQSSMLPAIK